MASTTATPQVAVVGGGVLGVSTAAALARRGAHVILVTRGPLADGATGRSLSWLNSAAVHPAAYHRLRVAGLEHLRRLARELAREVRGGVPWLRFDGALAWSGVGETPARRVTFDHLRAVGYPARWLAPDDVAACVPGVDPGAVAPEGALFTPEEGWVDLVRLVEHLRADLVRHGGTVVTGAGPCEVVVAGGRATGVRDAAGRTVGADAVVLATGADVPRAAAQVGVVLPDATGTGLLVRTAPVACDLRAVVVSPRVSVRPAPGGRLVLDAGWSEREVERDADGAYRVRPSTVAGLLREASAVLTGRPDLTVDSVGVGPKPVPGDGEPVLGPLPGVAGYHVAFTHSGATLGLVVGELLAREVVDGRPEPLLEPFRPARFAVGR